MSKYSNEFKLKVVKYCIEEHHGVKDAAKHFSIPAFSTVRKWVNKYNEHGVKGLVKNLNSSYSGEFKQNVVEYMHENHLSAIQTAIHFNLGSVDQATRWERIYYTRYSCHQQHGGIRQGGCENGKQHTGSTLRCGHRTNRE